ncbi:unnamed protein product [Mytilus coruscus]|uniref:Uncharacterized protein n=1 Tax=Mytilus coruscus TaxID=42192 RepID=A0A6J8CXC7_MYTCO|nr:unnamed protein product [Mytilus coruscus]
MPITRNKARKNYKLISEFGFGHEDILDVSDPTSDIFDNKTSPDDEINMMEHRIHNLEVSISEKERVLEKADYEKQGAISKTRLKSKSVASNKPNDLVKEKGVGEKSSRPRQLQSSAPKVKSTKTAGKKTKPTKRKDTRDSKSFKSKVSESSDSSDSDSSESSTDEVTSSKSDTDSSRKKKSLKKRKVKSGMVAQASDDVQNPQTWPHTTLQYEYINKSVSFQDLDLKLFVAGELEIIGSSKIKTDERNTRLSLLKKIVYYSSIYQWKSLLDFYGAFLRQIETGVKT